MAGNFFQPGVVREPDARRRREKDKAKPNGHDPDLHFVEGSVGLYATLREMLACGESGNVFPTHANLLLILKGDPLLRGLVRRDEFANRIQLERAPPTLGQEYPHAPGPYPRPLADDDNTCILSYLQKVWARGFRRATLLECISVDARNGRFHPVRDWLATLTWDGQARLNAWLTKTFGCPLDDYHIAVGSKLLIAAVRRVRSPGCKFDYLVVFEGNQGILKSTAIQRLFGAHWFTDDMPRDVGNKDAAIALAGAWCVEMGEIEHLLKVSPETIKAFLSRAVDRYRPPYGREMVECPRQCVMVGTSNSSNYGRDASGARRLWPVQCLTVDGADVAWLVENRDQLWAEAAHREAAGESIWLDQAAPRDRATVEQAARLEADPWQDAVLQWVSGKLWARTTEVLTIGLGVDLAHQTKSQEMRVANILRSNGWVKGKLERVAGFDVPVRLWYPPQNDTSA